MIIDALIQALEIPKKYFYQGKKYYKETEAYIKEPYQVTETLTDYEKNSPTSRNAKE